MGAVVYEQGLVVNSIESAVEQTSVFVSQGTENLRKSCSYKVNNTLQVFILLLVLGYKL